MLSPTAAVFQPKIPLESNHPTLYSKSLRPGATQATHFEEKLESLQKRHDFLLQSLQSLKESVVHTEATRFQYAENQIKRYRDEIQKLYALFSNVSKTLRTQEATVVQNRQMLEIQKDEIERNRQVLAAQKLESNQLTQTIAIQQRLSSVLTSETASMKMASEEQRIIIAQQRNLVENLKVHAAGLRNQIHQINFSHGPSPFLA